MEWRMARSLGCPFFKTWDHDMAYILGYWFADGNMYTQKSCGGYVVSIGSKDVDHLEMLRNVIGVGTLTRITGSEVFKLVICRKEMYEDLLRLGGTERKSLTLTWPEVPEVFLAHFVRGYVVGTREFLTGMGTAIEEAIGVPIPTRHRQKNRSNLWVMN
jgi:hypothetical protein